MKCYECSKMSLYRVGSREYCRDHKDEAVKRQKTRQGIPQSKTPHIDLDATDKVVRWS